MNSKILHRHMSGDDVQVLLVDQQRINKFSRLNNRLKDVVAEIDMLKVWPILALHKYTLESRTNL